MSVKVTASDGNGGKVSDTFEITLESAVQSAAVDANDGTAVTLTFHESLEAPSKVVQYGMRHGFVVQGAYRWGFLCPVSPRTGSRSTERR